VRPSRTARQVGTPRDTACGNTRFVRWTRAGHLSSRARTSEVVPLIVGHNGELVGAANNCHVAALPTDHTVAARKNTHPASQSARKPGHTQPRRHTFHRVALFFANKTHTSAPA
jgi:hypothetical protein